MLYEDLLNPILLEARGCPDLLALRVLRDEVWQLYYDNRLWVHTDNAAIAATDGSVSLALPVDSEVVAVRRAECADWKLTPHTVDHLMTHDYTTGDPAVIIPINGVLTVMPPPAVETTITVDVQLAPTHDADGVDDVVAREHRRIYQHLALARLLSMRGQKWFDGPTASYHESTAISLIFQAKRRADGWTTQRTPVRYGGI